MQKTTKTTVTLDATEVKDIIAKHLRAEGNMPEKQKFTLAVLIPCEHGSHDVHTAKDSSDFRIQLDWPTPAETTVVRKVAG